MDPRLKNIVDELEKTRWAALVTEPDFRLVWVSTEMKVLLDEHDEDKLGYGKHMIEVFLSDTWASTVTAESQLNAFFHHLPLVIDSTEGGKEAIKEMVGPELAPYVDDLEPREMPPLRVDEMDYIRPGMEPTTVRFVAFKLFSNDGDLLGHVELYGSALPARILALVARGDEGMFLRMADLVEPGRRSAAVLFADIQDSGSLSRRLPSAAYFTLIRAIITAIDGVVTSHKGIVGKHAGDGASAFFLAEHLGSSSGAARAAIETARGIAQAAGTAGKEIADQTGLFDPSEIKVNVGVHWGGKLYMGQLVTGGRLEVTALGDAVNECARIQGTARNGTALASKNLIEHLTESDAHGLGLDPDGVVYRPLGEIPGAGDKTKRDAGSIPVTSL
jgi:class 3 adenylate cyclase